MSQERIDLNKIERIRIESDKNALLAARKKTWQALHNIAEIIQPGMREADIYTASLEILKRAGVSKYWHRPWIRFSSNTLKSFGQQSEPGVRLRPNDIFFIDIGPVWGDFEGDAGETFIVGEDAEMQRCKLDVKRIFLETKRRWEQDHLSGDGLYRLAQNLATELGWVLNLEVDGHTLSNFPHVLHYRGSLRGIHLTPSPYNWVLEIQIRHPKRDFGAFYEDLLLT